MNLLRFKKDIGLATMASIFSFIISFALTPIMTRWYEPSDYGVFAVVNNLATFIATAMLFSLPNAIPLEQFWYRRVQLLRALFDLTLFVVILTSLGVLVYVFIKGGESIFLLLPLLVFSISSHRISQGWANADGAFSTMALGRVVHPLVTKPFAIIASMLTGSTPFYIIIFEMMGYLLQSYIMLRKRWKKLLSIGKVLSLKRIKKTWILLGRYKDFSLYLNLTTLLTLGFITLQVMIISMSYSVNQTGLFTLALSMVGLPVQLISMATASIVYHKFIELSQENISGLFKTALMICMGYMILGMVPYIVIYVYGETLFAFIFGEVWRQSGIIASILALPLFLQFITMPMISLFRVTKKIKFQFIIDSIFLIPIIFIFYILSLEKSFLELIEIYAMIMSIYSVVIVIIILSITWKFSKGFK